MVAERALSNDVADYIRSRAACSAWRRRSEDPRAHGGLCRQFHPRQWIVLRDKRDAARPHRRRFLNVSTGECIRMVLSELDGHTVLAVMPDEREPAVRLLNPLTGLRTDLPSVTAPLSAYKSEHSSPHTTQRDSCGGRCRAHR